MPAMHKSAYIHYANQMALTVTMSGSMKLLYALRLKSISTWEFRKNVLMQSRILQEMKRSLWSTITADSLAAEGGSTHKWGALTKEVPSKPPLGFHSELHLLTLPPVNIEAIVMDPFKEVKDYFPILRGKKSCVKYKQKPDSTYLYRFTITLVNPLFRLFENTIPCSLPLPHKNHTCTWSIFFPIDSLV